MTTLDIIILMPLLGVLAVFLGMPARRTSLLVAAINLFLALVVFWQFDRSAEPGKFQFTASRVLLESPKLSFSVGVDGMSVVMLILTVLVTLCAIWMSPKSDKIGRHANLYYISVLLISCGALGAFLSTDLFFFYAFHELALIPTFLMIGMLGHGDERVDVAWQTTIYLAVGSIILLAGLLALMIGLGGDTFDIPELQCRAAEGGLDPATQKWIFLSLLIGFGVLISLFPFHSWAAPAYAAAPTPVAMLHAGVLKKFGLYGLLRVALPMLPAGMEAWTNLLLVLLLGNILYIGFVTISQSRLDRMLAFSSVMHMGYVFLGVVSYNAIGLNGAVLLMFAHGISIALMFGLCGEIRSQLKSLDFDSMGGMGKTAPFMCLAFGLGAFASVGLPGFGNFASEVMVFFGAFKDYLDSGGKEWGALQTVTVLALWGVVISAVYMLRGFRKMFQGESESGWTLDDLKLKQRIPVCLLVGALLLIGIYPNILLDLLPDSVNAMLSQR